MAIETVSRALLVLELLNRRALTTLDELHQDSGLPKPTLVRLLRALMADGYVAQVSRTAGYRLAPRVLALTSGYQPRDLLVDVAQPLMEQFTRQHKWPLYLGTPEGMAVRVRCSTAPQSHVAPDHQSPYHYRFSLLVSAFGQAYLAFCPREERNVILSELEGKPDIQDGKPVDKAAASALLKTVVRNGYATTAPLEGDRGRGLAVPLYQGKRLIGALSMRHYRTTLTEAAAVQRYLEPLRVLAGEIGNQMRQAQARAAAPD